ncbi:1-phosphofructokinase [Candidatus Roizmanbacteria bacterium]|nr:1-phosphofructokinase [Candidatus Roizmanbacteria bacterium]
MIEKIGQLENKGKVHLLDHKFYRRVAIDVDSCLTGIEGIDLLAKIRGVGKVVTEMTRTAMGKGGLFNIALAKRLELIQPNGNDLDHVSNIYIENIVKDARGVIKLLQKNGVDAMLLSGGFRRSIIPLAEYVGIPKKNIYANDLIFGEKEEYLGFDGKNLLSQEKGKKKQIEELKYKKTGLYAIIGDGVSELETEPETDFRIGFGGFVSRGRVVKEADIFLSEQTFAPLILLLLNPQKIRRIFYEQPENRELLVKAFNSMSGVKFNNKARLLKQSIMELYEEFVFYAKNIRE